MKKTIIFFVILVLSVFPLTAFAHSGRTDSNGGHYDYSTGEYHYHHGYSAHQHKNGKCPFDFSDENLDLNTNSYFKKDTYFNYVIQPIPKENKTAFSINKLPSSDNRSILEITIVNTLEIISVSIVVWIFLYFLLKILILKRIFKKRYKNLFKTDNTFFMLFSFLSVWFAVTGIFYKNYILAGVMFLLFFCIAFKLWYYKNDKLYEEINKIR